MNDIWKGIVFTDIRMIADIRMIVDEKGIWKGTVIPSDLDWIIEVNDIWKGIVFADIRRVIGMGRVFGRVPGCRFGLGGGSILWMMNSV